MILEIQWKKNARRMFHLEGDIVCKISHGLISLEFNGSKFGRISESTVYNTTNKR